MSRLDPDSATAQAVADSLWEILRSQYDIKISSEEFKTLVYKETSSLYRDMVRTGSTLPRVNFGLPDERAMRYLENSDLVYLGKYVNSPELKARIVDYLREHYLRMGKPVGNTSALTEFINAFRNELNASKFEVRRIVDTTVSRARIFGQVNGLRASGAKIFEIAGPDDRLTCGFCLEMLGRQFEVALEISEQDKFITAGPENAPHVRPFLKGNLALDDLSDMDDAEVQAAGFAAPPYHPSCRHRLVVGSFYENVDEVPYSLA